ncbi:MAG TPA: hypothetical protein VFX59_28595, partial [Polyangiales bacterium]|nr:hypothetical protein [Polyangiales bacterium]
GPGCTRDDECVLQSTGVRCEGFVYGSCGTALHRDAAAQWDPDAVCRQIEALPAQRGLGCEVSPSCAVAEAACIDGRCSAR